MNALLLLLSVKILTSDLDAYIEKARVDHGVPGLAVTIVQGDDVVAKGYGVRRLGAPERIDENTRFDVASLTKSFNAAMIATLVDEGKLRWDDRVRDVLPSVVFPDPVRDSEVTLRDLLAHRVALEPGNMFLRLSGYDRAEMFRRIRYLRPQGTFRADFVYSNVMYAVSGAMAEAATGKSWDDLVRERLLVPLGMNESTSNGELAGDDAASPHAVIDGVQQPVRHFRFPAVAPAAAVSSTANDMAKWLRFQLGDGTWNGKRIISSDAMAEMHSPQMIVRTTAAMRAARGVEFFAAYGLGWQVMDYRGHAMLWHSGNANGMPTYMATLPKEKIGVAVMINTWAAPFLHGALASRILDSLLGLPTRDYSGETLAAYQRGVKRDADERAAREASRVAGTKPSAALDQYQGIYVDPLYGNMIVAREDDHLVLRFGRGEIADLTHWQYDTFAVRWRDPVDREDYPTFAAFALDESGRPSRFEMQLNRDRIAAIRSAAPR
jgi:CubicO group peptidase (beta-lactamase class C family)